jgi:metal-responsive CopG/Arc/MetJ family transcriptional regulator
METIQVVLDSKLLRAADRVARRTKVNRSALIREALRAHLRRLEIQALEERDRRGYLMKPQDSEDMIWGTISSWPED